MDNQHCTGGECQCGAERDNKKLIGFIPLSAILGVFIGILINYHTDAPKKINDALENDRKYVIDRAWSDGVMWGALAMKNMTENKQSTLEFGTVYQAAKDLKTQFAEHKVLPPPAPIMSNPATLQQE